MTMMAGRAAAPPTSDSLARSCFGGGVTLKLMAAVATIGAGGGSATANCIPGMVILLILLY